MLRDIEGKVGRRDGIRAARLARMSARDRLARSGLMAESTQEKR